MVEAARLLHEAALAHWKAGERAEAIEKWEQASSIVERDSPRDHATIQDRLSVGYRETGRLDRARVAARLAVARAVDAGDPALEMFAAVHLGEVYVLRGEYDDASKQFARGEE